MMQSNAESTCKQTMSDKKRVAIIGAGATGLCMVKTLADDLGTFEPIVFERGPAIGGIWNVEVNDSPIWDDMLTNTPRPLTQYGDFENKHGSSLYLHHKDVSEYIKEFTRTYNLEKFIKFNTSVTAVKLFARQEVEKWRVTCYDVIKEEPLPAQEFDAVVVCNGSTDKLNIPNIEGVEKFKGDIIHSRYYRQPKPYKNKKVLIIGAFVSGVELTSAIAPVADKIFISNKKDPLKYSFPKNVEEKPEVKRITESSVVFMDDSEEKIDSIIYCTGYKFSYPFLSHDVVQVDENRVKPLFKYILNIEHQSLLFLGLFHASVVFNTTVKHAQFVAAVISGKANLPPKEDMYKDAEKIYVDRMSKGYCPHFSPDTQWETIRELSKMAPIEPYPGVIDKLTEYMINECSTNIHYRKKQFKITGPDTFEVIN